MTPRALLDAHLSRIVAHHARSLPRSGRDVIVFVVEGRPLASIDPDGAREYFALCGAAPGDAIFEAIDIAAEWSDDTIRCVAITRSAHVRAFRLLSIGAA